MNNAIKALSWIVFLCSAPGLGIAQQPASPVPAETAANAANAANAKAAAAKAVAPKSSPQQDAGEPRAGVRKSAAVDRLDLGTATVTGDREQPKVMYIVPWKKSDIGDLSGKPMNSLLDEVLAPVDRAEFKREVAYYNAVTADGAQKRAAAPAAGQGEK